MKKANVYSNWDQRSNSLLVKDIDLYSEKQINIWVDSYPNYPKDPQIIDIGVYAEPPSIRRYIGHGYPPPSRFDYVLSHDQNILDSSDNCFLYEFGGCWTNDYVYADKSFGVSTLIGGKNMAPGHSLRTSLLNNYKKIQIPKTIWISKNYPPRMNMPPDIETPVLHGGKSAMFDKQFHICIENEKRENWFTEKLIDCLNTRTIPIYYGCPNIGDWFDVRGFIIVDNLEDIIKECNLITPDLYIKMLPYIEDNYNRAQLYLSHGKNIKRSIESNVLPLLTANKNTKVKDPLITKEYYPFNREIFNSWVRDNAKNQYRLDYPELNKDSIVIDCGGYKGEWAQKIHSKYGCNVLIFEPIEEFYSEITRKFDHEEKVRVFKLGVSANGESFNISLADDSSSMHNTSSGDHVQVETVNLLHFLNNLDIKKVDLIKLNIEGSEYEILEDILDNGKSHLFSNIQVQFHRFIEDCYERRAKIGERLSKTHTKTYDYEFIWENWKMK
jgi:FkbM family methyltransferase